MRIPDTKKLLKAHFAVRQSVELRGSSGSGKTETVRQTVAEIEQVLKSRDEKNNVGLLTFDGPTLDAMDLRGLPDRYLDEQGRPCTRWTQSPLLPPLGADGVPVVKGERCPYGVIFIDEKASSDPDVIKILTRLQLDHQLGDTKLPMGWRNVWSASNRMSDNAGVNKDQNQEINRKTIVNFEAHLDDWSLWAEANGIHHSTIAFAKLNPGLVFHNKSGSGKETENPQFCSPRSLAATDTMLQHLMPKSTDRLPASGWISEMIAGKIGDGAGAMYMAHLDSYGKVPTFEQIIANPSNTKCPDVDETALQLTLVHMLAHRVTNDDAGQVFHYLCRMPKEMQVVGVQMMMRKAPKVVQHTKFKSWMDENRQLIVAANAQNADI